MKKKSKLLILFLFLVFISGFAGLVYEILWMKQIGLLFGNTSQAAAVTFAAFFGGLAAGSWFWGKITKKMKNPLRVYALLEVGIATTAIIYFFVLHAYYAIYPMLYQQLYRKEWLLAVKFLLALVLVFPPAFFMGGTIPVIGQFLIRKKSSFGNIAALLYGTNTFGAALGTFMAGFFFPLWMGFRLTCFLAMTLNIIVAIVGFKLSKGSDTVKEDNDENIEEKEKSLDAPIQEGFIENYIKIYKPVAIICVCFLSGFGFLSLEVLWTRMFSQVLENSVYTYATILVIVLLCLAAGSFLSSFLAKLNFKPFSVLSILLLIGGVAVAFTPFIFMAVTNSFKLVGIRSSWSVYIFTVFGKGFMALGLPALLLGTIFPFLMKNQEQYVRNAGQSLGRLSAVNTTGAIFGSLVCGFFFIQHYGMWRTMQIIAVVYCVAAFFIPQGWKFLGIVVRGGACVLVILLYTQLDPTRLPITGTDPERSKNEVILETWETTECTIEVVKNNYGISIKMNSNYGLGSTGGRVRQQRQADIPLMAYPETESIFFLGMGTGITAGRSLDSKFKNVKKVVVCELVEKVIEAAKKYMTKYKDEEINQEIDLTNGLFTDKRATVLAEDGRHYMMASKEKFDMVIGDLFVPFRAGVGNLYTKEHFQNVKERLNPGGVFFQWIPLYQVTENEFKIMAKTMIEVFDQVSLWRDAFQPGEDIVAIVGHKGGNPLPVCDIDSLADKKYAVYNKTYNDIFNLDHLFLDSQTILFYYCGNLTQAKDIFEKYPINTDDCPVVEYMAPRSYRNIDTITPFFVGPRLAKLEQDVQKKSPPQNDPLLVKRKDTNKLLPIAGKEFYWAGIYYLILATQKNMEREEQLNNYEKGKKYWDRFLELWLREEKPSKSPKVQRSEGP